MNSNIWKYIIGGIIILCPILFSRLSFSNPKPEITFNPTEDAKTYMKLYEKDEEKAQEYLEVAILKYSHSEKYSQLDEFTSNVSDIIAGKSVEEFKKIYNKY
jgi:hypothetical protein